VSSHSEAERERPVDLRAIEEITYKSCKEQKKIGHGFRRRQKLTTTVLSRTSNNCATKSGGVQHRDVS
jgi:hypothetical protein